jgi:hypothetical protein
MPAAWARHWRARIGAGEALGVSLRVKKEVQLGASSADVRLSKTFVVR